MGLTVSFGGVRAVDGVDLDVPAGGIVGLIGPNGAGKTTLIDAVTGFVSPSAGTVTFAGADVTALGPADRARRGLVRTFQSLELFDDLSVGDNLRVAAEPSRWWDLAADAVRLRPADASTEAVDRALELFGLADVRDRATRDLSHGRRKLVALARALAAQPRLVLLDEPAAGLDTGETAELAEALRSLPGQGITVLLVDHDMGLVFDVCDEVVVLDLGSVIATGTPASVRADPQVVAAYLGAPAS